MHPLDVLTKYAIALVGKPYIWGGDDSVEGFDCSGFVQEILRAAGEDPPGDQTAQGLFDHFRAFGIIGAKPQSGSLAFYGKDAARISHVAFCINPYQMVEYGGGGSRTKTREDAIRDNAYGRIRLIHSREDLVMIIRPLYTRIWGT